VTEVRPVRSAVAVVGRGQNENVVTTAERILVERSRAQKNVRVVARSLVSGGTIEVPVGELAQVGNLLSDRLKGNYGIKKGGSTTWWERCLPCSLNEARCCHRSRHLNEKERPDEGRGNGAMANEQRIHSAWMLSPWSKR